MRRTAALAIMGLGVVGCRAPVATFPYAGPPIVWPPSPDTPRIRYLGAISGSASLGLAPRGWDAVRKAVTGQSDEPRFVTPTAVAADGQRLIVCDGQARAVYLIDLAKPAMRRLRPPGDGAWGWPNDVASGDGGWAVSDAKRAEIVRFDASGRPLAVFGSGALQRPASVAWDALRGRWWVVDAAAHQLVAFDRAGKLIRRIGGRGGRAGQFNFPAGMCADDAGLLAVADAMNFRVQLIDPDGGEPQTFGQKGDAAGDFSLPRDVAFDSQGHIYVLDNQFENVQVFDREGRLLMAFGEEGNGPGQFSLPSGISIDTRDRIWIADTYNRRVQGFEFLAEARE